MIRLNSVVAYFLMITIIGCTIPPKSNSKNQELIQDLKSIGFSLATKATDIKANADQIGKKVKSHKELGLPTPENFENWWPPKGYKPIKI